MENLLALARADGGAEAVALNPIRLDALLRKASQTWKQVMNQAMLNFAVEAVDEDVVVLADENGIQRLLSILLENASKYTALGGSIRVCAIADGERMKDFGE